MVFIKDLDALGVFVRESIFTEEEGQIAFRNKFFERFDHLEVLRRRPVIFFLENGKQHMIAGITFLEKMFDVLQSATWYREVSNTSEQENSNFKYLVLAAIALAMHDDIHKQMNFVGSFMNKEFDILSDQDINMVDFILDTYKKLDEVYIAWDNYQFDVSSDPLDFMYNLLNEMTHKYFINDDKTILHDLYRFSLAYNLVAYEETGNPYYKCMCYRNQISGLYINITSLSV